MEEGVGRVGGGGRGKEGGRGGGERGRRRGDTYDSTCSNYPIFLII